MKTMAQIVRVKTPSSDEVEIVLMRATGEDNRIFPDDVAITGYERQVRRRNPATGNEWIVIVASGVAATGVVASAVVQFLGPWIISRNGRRYKIRHGETEYEAPSIGEMKKLIKLAGDRLRIRILAREKPAKKKRK